MRTSDRRLPECNLGQITSIITTLTQNYFNTKLLFNYCGIAFNRKVATHFRGHILDLIKIVLLSYVGNDQG